MTAPVERPLAGPARGPARAPVKSRTRWRSGLVLVLLCALVPALVACGKRGSPRAPDAEPGDYTYPAAYPYPGTTLRSLRDVEVEQADDSDFGSSRLSSDDFDRTTTTTYGTE